MYRLGSSLPPVNRIPGSTVLACPSVCPSVPCLCLLQVNELPNNGAHIPVVQEAEALMRRIEMEQKANALLEEAMQRRDLNALTNAIAGCDRMQPPLRHERLDQAREMMVRTDVCSAR